MSVRAGLRPPPLGEQVPHRRAPAAQADGRGDGNHECAGRKEPDSCRGAATVDRVPAAARMAPPAAPRAADADVLCFRFGRPGLRQPISRSEEHTSELQSLMRISYAVFCLKKKNINNTMKKQTNCLHK